MSKTKFSLWMSLLWRIVIVVCTSCVAVMFTSSPNIASATDDPLYWSDKQAPIMYGTDEATIHAGETFDVKDSRYRVQARDFEDGDVTDAISVTSSNVRSDTPGDYSVSYAVIDSDGNMATFVTIVHVLPSDSSDGDWYVKRVYQNPNTWNTRELLRMNRGDYMDRQMLGVHLDAGKKITVSFLDSDSNLAVNLDCPTNDSKTDGTRTSLVSGNSVELQASDSIDTIPMVKTPLLTRGVGTTQQDIRLKIEYSSEDGASPVHFWTEGDDEQAFIDSWSSDESHPFAYIETKAFEGLPTWNDLSTIKNLKNMRGWVDSLADWSVYWVGVMDRYDSMLGLSIHPSDPVDQRVRTKYFCRANVNGAGGAYYNGGDHVGIHSANMASIFQYNWGGLHEVGHGYQGFMSSGPMYLGEVSNNAYGYAVQHDKTIYKASGEWMNFNGQESRQNAKRLAGEFTKFDEVESAGKLYAFLNIFMSVSPDNYEESHAEFFTWARQHSKLSGTSDNVDMLCKWLAEEHGLDVSSYFLAWGINVSSSTLSYLDSKYGLDRVSIIGDTLKTDESRVAYRAENASIPTYGFVASSSIKKYAVGDAEVVVDGSDALKQSLEGRLVALVGGDGTSEYVVATAPIKDGIASFSNVATGNWRIVMPDASGDGFDTAVPVASPRAFVVNDGDKVSATIHYIENGIVSSSSFTINGIYGTYGFKGVVDPSTSRFTATMGAARLINGNVADGTVVANVKLKSADGNIVKEWSVTGNGYFTDAGNENGSFDVSIGDTVEVYFSQYARVKFFDADGNTQTENAMNSATQEYRITAGGLVRVDRTDANPYEEYAIKKLTEMRNSLTTDELGNRFIKSATKLEASKLYSLIMPGDVPEIDEWIKKVRLGGTPSSNVKNISIKATLSDGINVNDLYTKIGTLNDAEDGTFMANDNNSIIYIDNRLVSEIKWDEYAGQDVRGKIQVMDTDGNATDIDFIVNVEAKKEEPSPIVPPTTDDKPNKPSKGDTGTGTGDNPSTPSTPDTPSTPATPGSPDNNNGDMNPDNGGDNSSMNTPSDDSNAENTSTNSDESDTIIDNQQPNNNETQNNNTQSELGQTSDMFNKMILGVMLIFGFGLFIVFAMRRKESR